MSTVAALWRNAVADRAVFLLVGIYVVAVAIVFQFVGLPLWRPSGYLYNALLYLASTVFVLGLWFLGSLLRNRPESPVRFVGVWSADRRIVDRVVLAAPAIAAMIVFLPAFSAFKSAIPVFNPFSSDPALAEIDAALHGGDAWLLFQPVLGFPIVSFLVNGFYQLWLLLLYPGVLLVAGWLDRPDVRRQFLLSFVLCWILLGSIMAVAMPSVGPCFYEYFFGQDRFVPLMGYLYEADHSFPLAALEIQEQLLAWHQQGNFGLGRGISAMPSMHVSIACLFALAGFARSKRLGIAGIAYLAAIQIGSVHLGYHYAIDGYVSILATVAVWYAAGLVQRNFRRDR